MDLRFVACNLIARDVLLRTLLVNYADRIEHGRAPIGPAPESCFIVLKWTTTEDQSQILTARAHLPRRCWTDSSYLDLVLQRLRAVLAADPANLSVSTDRRGGSVGVLERDVDTIFKTSTLEITPAPPQRRVTALRPRRVSSGSIDLGEADFLAPERAAHTVN